MKVYEEPQTSNFVCGKADRLTVTHWLLVAARPGMSCTSFLPVLTGKCCADRCPELHHVHTCSRDRGGACQLLESHLTSLPGAWRAVVLAREPLDTARRHWCGRGEGLTGLMVTKSVMDGGDVRDRGGKGW